MATKEVLITINKAESSVTDAPEAIDDLKYTGSAQDIVNAGTARGGTMNYACSTDPSAVPSEWSETVPSQTDTGTYYVWYKVVGDENHEDSAVSGPIEVTIDKGDPKGEIIEENYPVSNEPLTYNGSAQKLLNDPAEYPEGYDTVLYSTDGGTSWNDKAEATDAGMHQILFQFTSANYEDLIGPAMGVRIEKATGSVTSDEQRPEAIEDLKYSESNTELIKAPEELPEGYEKVQYSLDNGKTWTDSIPKGQGGDYKAIVKYIGDKNHNDFVGKYELTVTVQNSYSANDTTWTKGSSDGDYLDPSKYDKAPGSVRVTLKSSYLETLSVGKHSLTAYFSDGTAVTANFRIMERRKPSTPDYILPKKGIE